MSQASASVEVLYQDDYILAVDKPQGILVHSDGTGAVTLTDLLLSSQDSIDATQLQALHRLDFDTSGVVLFSLNKTTQPLFDQLIAARELKKTYIAILDGVMQQPTLTNTHAIGRDRHNSHKMRACTKGGQEAYTQLKRLSINQKTNTTLVEVLIKTGRKHQIRVHCQDLGLPILNDPLYNTVRTNQGLMLHARSLSFMHSVSHNPVIITTPWPARFSNYFPEV